MQNFRYRKPGYVAIQVSDIDRSVAHYRDIVGLTLEQSAAGVAFMRCNEDHHNLVLYAGEQPGLRRMAFQMASDADLDAIEVHLTSLGCTVERVSDGECADLYQGRTIRTRLRSCALQMEFYANMQRAATPFLPSVAKIQRLGHVVVALNDRDAVLKTLVEQLNFKVSDHFGDQVAFLRCFPNPYHHSFGLARTSGADHLHHINFMVSDIDDIGRANNRLQQRQVEIVYGPGRHDISNSIFIYFLDPDGITNEYSFGMEEFAEIDARPPRILPLRPEILDCWGGFPKEKFGKVGKVTS
jgi:2,3-dihydroxy-p-cumate/2,3-dihydroxybenzoate 3,4-dioxygenase